MSKTETENDDSNSLKQKVSEKMKTIIEENAKLHKDLDSMKKTLEITERKLHKKKSKLRKSIKLLDEVERELYETKEKLIQKEQTHNANEDSRAPEVPPFDSENGNDDEGSQNSQTETPISSTSNYALSPVFSTKSSEIFSIDSAGTLEEAFRECARRGQSDRLRQLVDVGVDINSRDESGYTALHWTAISGKTDCLRILITSKGCDVNITDQGGWTALHYAAYKGHKGCVIALLIVPEIDIDIKNSLKKTAAQLATKKEIVSILKESRAPSVRLLLEESKELWSKRGGGAINGMNWPEAIQKKEQELLEKEKLLLEKEQSTQRFEGELKLLEQTVRKHQSETEDLQIALEEKKRMMNELEQSLMKKLETQGEKDLGNSIFTLSWDEVKVVEEIGHGTFGSVYKALWRGDFVAAKKIKCKVENTPLIQAFQKETALLAKIRHPNIVMILAACCQLPDLVILTELMKSDLSSLIYGKEKIEWKLRMEMALDIARGMNFLHKMTPLLVHRDLKSQNLLLDDNLKVKISDFGTVTTLEKIGEETAGTAPWMCPARLCGEDTDEKTDVFSYGVVLWELLNRKIPWEGLSNIQIVARVGHAGERLPLPEVIPKGCPNGFISMIRDCWETHTIKRPSFEQIISQMREILQSHFK